MNHYNLNHCPDWLPMSYSNNKAAGPFWSGENPPPAIGSRVKVRFNGFGDGTVTGYFLEEGFLGLEVAVDKQPDWHIKQGGTNPICVFGAECKDI